jgi:hypothetical protein
VERPFRSALHLGFFARLKPPGIRVDPPSDGTEIGEGTKIACFRLRNLWEGITMRNCAVSLLTLAALALAGGGASADPIGPVCGTCQGSIYTLEYSGAPISSTLTTETFRITLTIDTSGYDGAAIVLNAVAVKVSSMLLSMSLFSAPAVTGGWTTWMGGLNANGCSGSGSGLDCAYAGSTGVAVPDGTYTWMFDLEMNTGTLFTTPNSSSIKVRYADDYNNKVGDLVSENITLQVIPEVIPEPTTAALLAGGLLALAITRRARR